MTTHLGSLPDGTKGFDANTRISNAIARLFYDAGYRFVVRYVRRASVNPNDITVGEMAGLLEAGLGLMLVQHVAQPGWHATAELGRQYGQTAALEATRVGYPKGGHLWCDLEEVDHATPSPFVIGYCNAWYDAVSFAGYRPGLYVGYGAKLTAEQLYRKLRFSSYWSAYNLNREDYPAVRGVMMRQRAIADLDRVEGCTFEFDVNVIKTDAKRGTPTLLLP